MKFLVSPADQTQDTSGLFKGHNSKLYNYTVEYNEGEDLRITDSLGRIMPIAYTEIRDFAVIFTALADFQESKEMFEEVNLRALFETLTLN